MNIINLNPTSQIYCKYHKFGRKQLVWWECLQSDFPIISSSSSSSSSLTVEMLETAFFPYSCLIRSVLFCSVLFSCLVFSSHHIPSSPYITFSSIIFSCLLFNFLLITSVCFSSLLFSSLLFSSLHFTNLLLSSHHLDGLRCPDSRSPGVASWTKPMILRSSWEK